VRVRGWTEADHYDALGVTPSATREEIAAAYRARARVLHPDAGTTDAGAEAEFVRVAAAYRILTGPRREEYDQARLRASVVDPSPPTVPEPGAPASAPSRLWPATRQGARGALWSGVALVLGALVAAMLVVALQVRDARLRDDGVPVRAIVVRDGGVPQLRFSTRAGEAVQTALPDPKSGGYVAGDVVDVRYDADDPTRVVTERSTLGRDITLWIVAAKLLVVGAVLAVVGIRRLLRPG
jgi:hypothetical protein